MLDTQSVGVTVATPSVFRLCVDCGESISAKRLIAKPHTFRCVDCQARNDLDVMREPATNMLRLGWLSPSINDDDLPRGLRPISSVGLSQMMSKPEQEPGQATNTKHRVISTAGRSAMRELSHVRRG